MTEVVVEAGDVAKANDARLRSFVERIERLEEEKKTFVEDIKDVYNEAKADGFDKKVLKQVVKIRAQDRAKVAAEREILDVYLSALNIDV